jgi:DNA transposition AAA+ family ATPase
MRDGTIITENVRKGLLALADLRQQHAVSPGRDLLVLQAPTGRGKTQFAKYYRVQNHHAAVYREADPDWTSSWLMRDVAEALGLPRLHSLEANKRQIVAAQRRQPRLIIFDEANRIIRSTRLLETVRGLHDAGLALALVGEGAGNGGLWAEITRSSPRFQDRVCQVIEFTDVTAADIEATARELADLALTPEIAESLRQAAGGNFRRAAKILEELERLVRANPGEMSRKLVSLAVNNLKIAQAREEKRRAAGGGGR